MAESLKTIKRLPPLPTIADIIRIYGLSARKQLSQNFILDLNVTDKFVRVAKANPEGCVCEVGPGTGAITRSLLNANISKVVVVEKDSRFIPSLELLQDACGDRLDIHLEDILKFDWENSLKDIVKSVPWEDDVTYFDIIGNLPFSVSIPLLLQWLRAIPTRSGPFKYGRSKMTLTFQKEITERLLAKTSGTQRSRLSIMAQTLCDIKLAMKLPSKVFTPSPKVDAGVVVLKPLVKPRIDVDYPTLELVVKSFFQHRRKMIKRGAEVLFPEDDQKPLAKELLELSGLGESQLRPQDLSLEQFESLTNNYTLLKKRHLG